MLPSAFSIIVRSNRLAISSAVSDGSMLSALRSSAKGFLSASAMASWYVMWQSLNNGRESIGSQPWSFNLTRRHRRLIRVALETTPMFCSCIAVRTPCGWISTQAEAQETHTPGSKLVKNTKWRTRDQRYEVSLHSLRPRFFQYGNSAEGGQMILALGTIPAAEEEGNSVVKSISATKILSGWKHRRFFYLH